MKNKFLLLMASCCALSFAQSSLKVDLDDKEQLINMIGTDIERSADFFQKAANPEQMAKWIVSDIPYKVVRVSYDKQQELEEGVPTLDFYDDAIKTMQMLRAANPDIEFFGTLKSDYNGYGTASATNPTGRNNLPNWICDWEWKDNNGDGDYDDAGDNTSPKNTYFYADKYARFLYDYLKLMADNGVDIKYLTVSKEWGAVITSSRTIDIIENLVALIDANGNVINTPLFCDPSAWSVDQSISFIEDIISAGKEDLFHSFTTHHYNNSQDQYPAFVAKCEEAGKYAWNDEVGYGTGPYGAEEPPIANLIGTYGSRAQFYEDGLEGEIFFEITSRASWATGESRAIYFSAGAVAERKRSYYVGKLFAENIYNHYYVPVQYDWLSSSYVKTMAFADDEEVVVWALNTVDVDYTNIELALGDNSEVLEVVHYLFTEDNLIQGEASQIFPENGKYMLDTLLNNSINVFKFKIAESTSVEDQDVIKLDADSVEFGFVNSTSTESLEQVVYLSVNKPSQDVTITFEGADAANFAVTENASIVASNAIYFVPVKVDFIGTQAGQYTANLKVTSGSNTVSIPVTAEVYVAEVNDMPFKETFASLLTNTDGPISNSTLNAYVANKGWEVVGATKTVNQSETDKRIYLTNTSNEPAYALSPEINFDGPFELRFHGRMLVGNKSNDTYSDAAANNKMRTFYAVIGNDTIYDHTKTGSSLYQNYNAWTCSYAFTGTERIKFGAVTSNEGIWEGLSDGMIFGTKDSISVVPTERPTVNIGYGHVVDLGEQLVGSEFIYGSVDIKAWNMSNELEFLTEVGGDILTNPSSISPEDEGMDTTITIRINTASRALGDYVEKIIVKGDDNGINERTIYVKFSIVNQISSVDKVPTTLMEAYGLQGNIFVQVDTPQQVSVYNLAGVKVYSNSVQSQVNIDLKQGLYIVVAGDASHKVVVK